MVTRRDWLMGSAALLGGAVVLGTRSAAGQDLPAAAPAAPAPGRGITAVVTPNGTTLPWRVVDGVKVFHLVPGVVPRHEMAPGLVLECWGYNGRTSGPTIEVVEGDRCRFYVTNRLPEPTTVHWHGVILPSGMDGIAGLSQRAIAPGETFKYEFTFRHPGTFMYHPHFDEMTQMAMGMAGMIVVHPRAPRRRVQRDFALMLSEWKVRPGARRPDPLAMNDFNMLTINSKAFPGTAPLVVRKGDRVRIRLGNLSAMDHHPFHIHGQALKVTATDGGPIPEAGQWPETTVLVPVGTTRDVEFVADAPGDWAMHCHMTHHVMNQMGHEVPNVLGADLSRADRRTRGLLPGYMTMGQTGMGGHGEHGMPVPPNSIPMRGGQGPFGTIDMGGMFTVLKVREDLASYDGDPGWYRPPAGTVAERATAHDLAADGIDPEAAIDNTD